jgi:hypothetical protein
MRSFLLLALLLAPCDFVVPQSSEVTQEIQYCDLVRAPQQFAGKRIRVRAIYRYVFEKEELQPPSCCSEVGPKIWVAMDPEENSLSLYHKFPKGMGTVLATFEGKFDNGGPFGGGGYQFRLRVDKIENLERKAKTPHGEEPIWVPTNCNTSTAK